MKFPFLTMISVLSYISALLGPAYYAGSQPVYGFQASVLAFFISLSSLFMGDFWQGMIWACHCGTAANALAFVAMGFSQSGLTEQAALCAGAAFVGGLLALLILWLHGGFLPGAGAGIWLASFLGLAVANAWSTTDG